MYDDSFCPGYRNRGAKALETSRSLWVVSPLCVFLWDLNLLGLLGPVGKQRVKPLIQQQMILKNCFCYLITWAVREKVVKVKSMRGKRCNSMGSTAVHWILIFNSPLFWGIAGNYVDIKAYQCAFQFIYLHGAFAAEFKFFQSLR